MIGVNLFGDLTGEGSLSEIARMTANALERHGVAFSYNELILPYVMYRDAVINATVEPRNEVVYPANLFCYNINLFSTLPSDWLAKVCANRYTMGLWTWEMSDVPEVWHGEFAKLDEIWCPSDFVSAGFRKVTRKPIITVPHPIELLPRTQGRDSFGLEEGRTVFLFTLSALSGHGRKNPWGVIDAYRLAFGDSNASDKPLLLMKVQHSRHYPELVTALTRAVDSAGGRIVTDTYSRQRMHDLYHSIDCYVSLHRAEGFGLGLAEAMAARKPVITTTYSGPRDFLTPENSFQVDYELCPIIGEDHVEHHYRPGMIWAEADVGQAAAHMVAVYEHPEEARAKGECAAQHIQTYCSPSAVAVTMEKRIRQACSRGR